MILPGKDVASCIEPSSQYSLTGLSVGPTHYGYDCSISEHYKVCSKTGLHPTTIIVGNPSTYQQAYTNMMATDEYPFILLPPGQSVLVSTMETISIQPKCIGLFFGRSTLHRLFVTPHVSPLEPGWSGKLTVQLYNSNNRPVAIPRWSGFGQVVILQSAWESTVYNGKYQGQSEPTIAR